MSIAINLMVCIQYPDELTLVKLSFRIVVQLGVSRMTIVESEPPYTKTFQSETPILYHHCPSLFRKRFKSHLLRFSRLRNSSRVFALDLIAPNIQLVVVVALVFCTPLITMHK